jgi:hypothetical protein
MNRKIYLLIIALILSSCKNYYYAYLAENGTFIKIKPDSTFDYYLISKFDDRFSNGKAKLYSDSIVLNSQFKTYLVPLKVLYKKTKEEDTNYHFNIMTSGTKLGPYKSFYILFNDSISIPFDSIPYNIIVNFIPRTFSITIMRNLNLPEGYFASKYFNTIMYTETIKVNCNSQKTIEVFIKAFDYMFIYRNLENAVLYRKGKKLFWKEENILLRRRKFHNEFY